jgi:hypothetical protein
MPFKPADTLDPIVSDKLAAGGMLTAMKVAKWCLANPDYVNALPSTPASFFFAMETLRSLVFDVVDDYADVNRSQCHADAVMESLGLTGLRELINAMAHHRRTRPVAPFAEEMVGRAWEQLSNAIDRLTLAIESSAPVSK